MNENAAMPCCGCESGRLPIYSRSTLHGFQNTRAMRRARIDLRAVALFVPATLIGGDA